MENQETQLQAPTSDTFSGIEDALNVETSITKESPKLENITKAEVIDDGTIVNKDEIKKDYEYARNKLYILINKGEEAIDGILALAGEMEHPRAYEVAGNLIKQVGDVTDKLSELHKKMVDIETPKGVVKEKNTITTTNSVFVGSTAELTKFLGSQKNQ